MICALSIFLALLSAFASTEARHTRHFLRHHTYDLAGNLTNKVDFNGHATGYAYDSVNRLLTKTPDEAFNAPPVTMTYTATGQRATMSDAGGTTTYYYNSRDWLTNKAVRFYIPGGARYTSVLGYGYDAHGNVTHISSSDPNGVDVGYTYDPLNRLENVNDAQTGTTTYGYDDVGNLAGYVYPNNVSSTYAYDSLNRLTNLSTLNPQLSTVAYYNYTVAAGGQRLTANENVVLTNGVRTINRLYNYDATYRLTHEGLSVTDPLTLPATAEVGYTLDDVGNRLARQSTLNSILSTSSTFDANDRLTSDTYDANGNTVSGSAPAPGAVVGAPPTTLRGSYDFEDRLVIATNASGAIITLTYDGDGNRVAKTMNGVTMLYLVDDRNPSGYAQVLEEETTTGGTPFVTRAYAYGHSIISQTFEPSTLNPQPSTFFYGSDGHNNVRYLTDTAGNLTDTYDYDAFGNLIAQSGSTANSYLYCGEQFDSDLGLYYNRARYLNTDSGRFWTMDDFDGKSGDPQSLHKYLFVQADPVNAIDRSGYMTLTEVMSSLGIDSINNGIKGFNAIKTACKANQVVNIAATLKFWTAVAMMVLGDTINPNTMQVGIRWVEKNYAPASLVEKASFGVFLSRRGTPKYQFGIDLKKGAAIRVNWTPFGDFSIQGGVNTKFDKITICGAPVAEASLQYRRGVVVNPNKYRSPSVWSLGVQIEVLNAMRFQVKLAGTDASPIF